ncbi:hypothetical protein [Streptomyces sp. CC0208]|uniref:hypothetical protein n=1 Tax=Streptomyces sp. CC0208 TaxID=2306165 RepID=UPI0002D7E02E
MLRGRGRLPGRPGRLGRLRDGFLDLVERSTAGAEAIVYRSMTTLMTAALPGSVLREREPARRRLDQPAPDHQALRLDRSARAFHGARSRPKQAAISWHVKGP